MNSPSLSPPLKAPTIKKSFGLRISPSLKLWPAKPVSQSAVGNLHHAHHINHSSDKELLRKSFAEESRRTAEVKPGNQPDREVIMGRFSAIALNDAISPFLSAECKPQGSPWRRKDRQVQMLAALPPIQLFFPFIQLSIFPFWFTGSLVRWFIGFAGRSFSAEACASKYLVTSSATHPPFLRV